MLLLSRRASVICSVIETFGGERVNNNTLVFEWKLVEMRPDAFRSQMRNMYIIVKEPEGLLGSNERVPLTHHISSFPVHE